MDGKLTEDCNAHYRTTTWRVIFADAHTTQPILYQSKHSLHKDAPLSAYPLFGRCSKGKIRTARPKFGSGPVIGP